MVMAGGAQYVGFYPLLNAYVGFLKGKSVVRIHREIMGQKQVRGLHFWARGYCVSTVGLDEATIRKYIREQDDFEKQQLELDLK